MENTPNYYAVIPANVRYNKKLRANEKLLYGEITALASKSGECWASNNHFADLYDVTPQAISKWISDLEQQGYISTQLIYETDKKEVEKRIIKILEVSTNIDRVSTNVSGGYQQKFKENNTSNNNNNICSSDEELAENFDKIWKLYPRKDGKNTAFAHYKSWLKGKKYAGRIVKLNNKQMWFATKKYADLVEANKTEKQYIKMGSTFFNEAIMEYVEEE